MKLYTADNEFLDYESYDKELSYKLNDPDMEEAWY